MEVGWNANTILSIGPDIAGAAAAFWLLRKDWKHNGILMALAAAVGIGLCWLFTALDLYVFPFRLFPSVAAFPFITVIFVFPAYVGLAVRYAPGSFKWKIPYYWTLVHIVVLMEFLIERNTDILQYRPGWNIWLSYLTWWLFMVGFEWIGSRIVPGASRHPLDVLWLQYGRLGWFVVHFVMIATFFLIGLAVGMGLT